MDDKQMETISPADARSHAAWPTWKKTIGYGLLMALSLAAIWLVDVKVHRPQFEAGVTAASGAGE
jgi:heme/copper-type cytochrome/quinol oxidase subunit 4